jgi:hypothetical protein
MPTSDLKHFDQDCDCIDCIDRKLNIAVSALLEIRSWLNGRKALVNCMPIFPLIRKGLGEK